MPNVCRMVWVEPRAYVCQDLAALDAKLNRHARQIRAKTEELVHLLVSAIDVIVLVDSVDSIVKQVG